MKKLILLLSLTISLTSAYSQKLDKKFQPLVTAFINCIKNKQVEKLSTKINYPLNRAYPIPPIKNKAEFLKRYKEVFDDELSQKISSSKPLTDWDDVGWRGIMLLNGDVWLDYDGKLLTVTDKSAFEAKERARLIALEKTTLHPSINDFANPVLIFETAKYRIRIDDLGKMRYRYTSWPIKNKMSDKPALIIKNGNWTPEGSGGNHNYQFKSGDYLYTCYITVMGEKGAAPATLVITRSGKEILSQDAKRMTP